MSNVDTDKIKEGKEEFENNNTRPGWDKQNYVAVLERYKFPTHCIEAGKLLGAADPKALYAHIQANPSGFDEDHVQEFLELDLNTKTFDVIEQLSFSFINMLFSVSNCIGEKLFSQPILDVPPPASATPIDVPFTATACAPTTSSSLPTCNVPSLLIK